MAARIAADPRRRDALSTASWRSGLRLIGFLGAALLIARIPLSLGAGRRNQPPVDASTAAIVVGMASIVALGYLGSSLLFPSRMGTPNRMVSMCLWIATVGAAGSACGLILRPDTWNASTPARSAITSVSAIALFALASVVSYARRRRPDQPELVDDEEIIETRLAILTAALARSEAAVDAAWLQLDAQTRTDLQRERADAIAALQQRYRGGIDEEWRLSTPPGLLGLPHFADETHDSMHRGHAQSVGRRTPGPFGYFVMLSRSQRSEAVAGTSDDAV